MLLQRRVMTIKSDFLGLGSGIAGLSFALKASNYGTVCVVTKRSKEESATLYAQGGIASVLSKDDTFESHIKDTIAAGAGLCKPEVVDMVVKDGPERIEELINLGARFTGTVKSGRMELDLGREGGHSKRRIVHAEDLTGREVEAALIRAVESDPNIKIYENHMEVDLITHSKFIGKTDKDMVWGAYVLDTKTDAAKTFLA